MNSDDLHVIRNMTLSTAFAVFQYCSVVLVREETFSVRSFIQTPYLRSGELIAVICERRHHPVPSHNLSSVYQREDVPSCSQIPELGTC